MILTVMLAITSGIVVTIQFVPVLNEWFWSLSLWGILGFGLGFVAGCIIVSCVDFIRHTTPYNYLAILILCLLEGCLLGAVTVHYSTRATLIALAGTMAICAALTLFATQVKYDFTACRGLVIAMIVILLVIGIAAIFVQNRTFHLVYSCLGLAFYSFILIFDIQMMIGGRHKYVNNPNEPIISALSLYIDIIMIFLYLLNILNLTDN